mgnify:FL=1
MAGIAQVWLMTYEAGFEDGDEALGRALSGNLYPYAGPMTDIGVHVMTDHMRGVIGGVLESPLRNLMAGEVVSPLSPNDANSGCYYAVT